MHFEYMYASDDIKLSMTSNLINTKTPGASTQRYHSVPLHIGK